MPPPLGQVGSRGRAREGGRDSNLAEGRPGKGGGRCRIVILAGRAGAGGGAQVSLPATSCAAPFPARSAVVLALPPRARGWTAAQRRGPAEVTLPGCGHRQGHGGAAGISLPAERGAAAAPEPWSGKGGRRRPKAPSAPRPPRGCGGSAGPRPAAGWGGAGARRGRAGTCPRLSAGGDAAVLPLRLAAGLRRRTGL